MNNQNLSLEQMISKADMLEKSAARKRKRIEDLKTETRKEKRLKRKKRFHRQSVRPIAPKSEKNIRRIPVTRKPHDGPIKVPSITANARYEDTDILCVISSESLEPIGGLYPDKPLYRRLGEKAVIKQLKAQNQ